jgi:hypothetical protein
VAASANAACSTTCGNSGCVMGFEASLDAAADILACSDATADACLCQTTSLDAVLLGCGANWEAPALGITKITLADGVKLGHVALLAQDIGPDMDANGLDIAGDQTDNDGVELFGGMYGASGRPLVPGVDPGFKFCASFAEIEDVSGFDDIWVGFRSAEPPQAAVNAYGSYAYIGWAPTQAGNWRVEVEDDGGTETQTDVTGLTNATDAAAVNDICVSVNDSGVVSFSVNGAAATYNGSAFTATLDSGDPVIPFITYLHTSDVGGELVLSKWQVNYPSPVIR